MALGRPRRPAALDRQPDQDDAVLVGLYAELAEETGKDPGWHELGGLRLASSKARYEEIQRQAGWAKSFGLPIEIVSAQEAQELFPPMSTDGVLAAAFIPQDGYLDPSQLTFALADGARLRGADIEQRTKVVDICSRTAGCTRSSPTRARSAPTS